VKPDRSRILIGCFEPPFYGGASTSGYQLFRALRDELDAVYLTLIAEADVARMQAKLGTRYWNPEHLAGAEQFVLTRPTFHQQPGLPEFISDADPSLLVGVGYIAAYVMKKARPDLPLVLITTGCQQVKDALQAGQFETVEQLLASRDPIRIRNDIERATFDLADAVVSHSHLVRRLCELYFPAAIPRIVDEVIWFHDWISGSARRAAVEALEFASRNIDILFVASDWRRVEKNYPLVKDLCRRFGQSCIHIVGEVSEAVTGAVHHGVLPNHEVLGLMGRSKVLVCPSSFDAAPGILFEGAALGCSLVASTNCGNHQICHPALLVSDFSEDGFARSIAPAMQAHFVPDTRYFEGQNALGRLVEVFHKHRLNTGFDRACAG